jgi:capsular exopolysaccharide synthesis family protein
MLLALCNPLDGNNMSRVYRALEKAEREKQEKPRVEPPLRIYRDETVSRPEVTIPRPPEQREKKPELPAKEKPPILIPPPHSFAAEQFPNPHHVILVTSSVPQEGKTLVSLNLALTIAQDIQKKTILIDGDLRRPSIHLPNLQDSKGLSTYLSHQIPLSEILMKSGEENLWVIPAGPDSGKSSELLGSKRMEDLLLSLKELEQETYVIIDSPPILSATESVILSRMADTVIFVVMADRTQREVVQKAMKSIDKQKIKGIVLNQMDMKTSRYNATYYYGHYGKKK